MGSWTRVPRRGQGECRCPGKGESRRLGRGYCVSGSGIFRGGKIVRLFRSPGVFGPELGGCELSLCVGLVRACRVGGGCVEVELT